KEFYFPFFITTVRVLFTLLALEILRNLKLINLSVLTLEESQSFLWPTICYIIQVTTSLGAMKGMSIPLYTSIKRCGPLINMVLSIILLKKKKPSWLSQVSVILAAIGCVISGTGELTVNYRGYVNATVSLLSKSFYFTLVEAQDYGVLKFIQLLCYNSLPILLFMSWFTDELNQAFSFIQSSDLQFLTLFVLTVVIGSCLVYVEFLCITLTSALTVSILGTIRSLCQIILGFFLVEGAPSNTLFLLGIGLNFFGGLLYLTEKLLLKSKYRYQYACFRNFFVRHDL
ncbi:solute carrier family 35 member D3-like, partial [Limulus polyphemus]|uniref:Solute carrier family 35 member D3-like n=1 Tax=Limulus polyphemus TaxID=6850 RepID=A0ABM1S4F0_LIMPO